MRPKRHRNPVGGKGEEHEADGHSSHSRGRQRQGRRLGSRRGANVPQGVWPGHGGADRLRHLAAASARAATSNPGRGAQAGPADRRPSRWRLSSDDASAGAASRPARGLRARSGPARVRARSDSPRSGSRATVGPTYRSGSPATASSSRCRIGRHAPMFCGSSCAQTTSSSAGYEATSLAASLTGNGYSCSRRATAT